MSWVVRREAVDHPADQFGAIVRGDEAARPGSGSRRACSGAVLAGPRPPPPRLLGPRAAAVAAGRRPIEVARGPRHGEANPAGAPATTTRPSPASLAPSHRRRHDRASG